MSQHESLEIDDLLKDALSQAMGAGHLKGLGDSWASPKSTFVLYAANFRGKFLPCLRINNENEVQPKEF